MTRHISVAIVIIVFIVRMAAAADAPLVEQYLHSGKLAEGENALLAALQKNSNDDQARFGLGTLQFLRAVEHMGQSLHNYGLRTDRGLRMNVPFLRLPVPENPRPKTVTCQAVRNIFIELINDLQKADSTLAGIKDEQVKLPLRIGHALLDFEDDGQPGEKLSMVISRYMSGNRAVPPDAELLIVFDRADVAWLRGYCHLLSSLAEIVLGYDEQELFDCTAHVFFKKVQTPHRFIADGGGRVFFDIGDGVDIVDIIAFVHLLRFPVKEPARLESSLKHMEQMLALSRENWKYILAETDDDHEWIPNPKQKGALGIPVRQEMIDSWLAFVAEGEDMLAGKKLIPLWRGHEKRGINMRRVFLEPRQLDVVMWAQGTAATPYLEEGELTQPAVWDRLQRVFRGEFLGFAFWFN